MDWAVDVRVRPPVRDGPADPEVPVIDRMTRYDELYGLGARINRTFDDLVGELERHRVRAIMQAEFEDTGRTRYWNERVATLVGRRPDLFIGGVAGVDPREPDALDELRWAHDDLGLRGLVVQPAFLGLRADDERILPLYAFCAEREVPVTVHCGVSFVREAPMDFGRPLHLDRVAGHFPELVIVCNHAGWPWVSEAIALAWRHPTVLLEFGAVAPRYLAHPDSGWAPMLHWMRTQLRAQVVLGTDWPMLDHDRAFDELGLLELPGDVLAAYAYGNAVRLAEQVWPAAEALDVFRSGMTEPA